MLTAPHPASAQAVSNPAVDRIFASWDKPESPGCAVGAIENGHMVYQRGYGMANLDYDIPNAPTMVYYVGSVSKQFTAASVALLAIRGQLSLDDDIRQYFPEIPAYSAPVRVRHLVHHTSGIRDIYGLMELRGDRMEDVFPDSQALSLIARQRGLAFAPGSAYSYSNSGYFLLAQLVKRVTHRTLRDFATTEIFQPLGMTRTHFHDDPGHVMKQRAMSYEPDGKGGFRISYLQNFDKVGAGGLYTTIGDLQRWDENYYTRRVGGDALHALIHTRGMLTNGDTLPYAFGNTISSYRGVGTVEHSGSLMGYKAYVLRFPEKHFSVLTTCNLGSIDPGPLSHAVAEVFLGDRLASAPAPARAPVPAIRANADAHGGDALSHVVAPLPGDYYSDDLDVLYRVARDTSGQFVLLMPRRDPQRLDSRESGRYRVGSMRVRFDPAGMTVEAARLGEIRFVRR